MTNDTVGPALTPEEAARVYRALQRAEAYANQTGGHVLAARPEFRHAAESTTDSVRAAQDIIWSAYAAR